MHIAVPIEIIQREFDAKVWLSGLLADDGHVVTLGQNKIIFENLDRIDPDAYIGLSAVKRPGRHKRFRMLDESGIKIFVLDTEGGAFDSQTDFLSRVDPMIMQYVDVYLAWGPESAKIARNVVQNHDLSTRIEVTGNPRFDLLLPEMTSCYQTEAQRISETHGNYILINTNFSINHIDKRQRDTNALRGKQDRLNRHKKQSRVLSEFISLINHIDNECDLNVVVRPHPIEDYSVYKTLLYPYENVSVTNTGDVKPWLLAADAIIHNSCTTGLEAAVMQRPVIAYLDEFRDSHVANHFSRSANNPEEVLSFMDDLTKSGSWNGDYDALDRYIGNTRKKAANQIRDIIRGIGDHRRESSLSNKRTLNEHLGARIYRISPGLYRRIRNSSITPKRWTHTSYKCGIIPVEKVRETTDRYGRWYDSPISISSYEYTDNLFRINQST